MGHHINQSINHRRRRVVDRSSGRAVARGSVRECAARRRMNRRKRAVMETLATRAAEAAMRAGGESDDVPAIGQATNANTPTMTGTPTTADAMAVTASMRWEAMWEQQPFNMTLAVGALPLGLFLASFGRRHHETCSRVVVGAFGAWLGMLGVDAVRDLLSDTSQIPDNACDLSDYNTYIAIAIALVVVYFGLREGGSSKGDAPSETEPLLGDAEKGKAKGGKKGNK